jgi:hypothetical protein
MSKECNNSLGAEQGEDPKGQFAALDAKTEALVATVFVIWSLRKKKVGGGAEKPTRPLAQFWDTL